MMPSPQPNGWVQVDLARQLSRHDGADPDAPILELGEGGHHRVLPTWQRYWTLAGAVEIVLREGIEPKPKLIPYRYIIGEKRIDWEAEYEKRLDELGEKWGCI